MDMVSESLVENLFLDHFAFFVVEHPVGELCMPAEVMSSKFDAVFAAEVGNTVGGSPIPHPLFRMQLSHLHVIFGGDAVELLFHQFHLFGNGDIKFIDRHTDGKIILVGIFQTLRRRRNTAHGHRQPACSEFK